MYEHMTTGETRFPTSTVFITWWKPETPQENQRYEAYYKKAIKIDPGNAEAHSDYGFFLSLDKNEIMMRPWQNSRRPSTSNKGYCGLLAQLCRYHEWAQPGCHRGDSLYRQALEAARESFRSLHVLQGFLVVDETRSPRRGGSLKKQSR